jgi:hypothetical protein
MKTTKLFGLTCAVVLILAGCCPTACLEHKTIPPAIVGQIIDHNDLQLFLHPEIEGRVPLIISEHLLQRNLSLSKFGEPVKILPESKLSDSAFLRFTHFKVKKDTAAIELEYKIEGVAAKYIFICDLHKGWQLRDSEIWEKK